MKQLLFIALLINSAGLSGQNLPVLVPVPVEVQQKKGSYIFKKQVKISSNFPKGVKEPFIIYLKKTLENNFGFAVSFTDFTKPADIKFSKQQMPATDKPAYKINVNQTGIAISSNEEQSAFHGIQTLLQLITQKSNAHEISFVEIFDYPRFQYRGMHLDIGRHFFPVAFIKKYIDYLATYKYNTFHWHLTEDQGWRIEIKKYPALTSTGGWRNGTIIGRYPGKGSDNQIYGGFYTQEEIKEVVAYAGERYIEVIPEIEMPGHSSAAIAAYPWLSCFPEKPTAIPANMISQKSITQQQNGRVKLVQETWGVFDDVFCAGKDSTFMFLQNVIDEVNNLFPSKYFHIGADECPKTHWKICPACQQKMKDLNLKDEHELQSWFVQRIEKYLNSKGKILIGWDEILEGGLAPNAVVMSWRGEAGGIEAAKQKHNVIMTPGNPVYFDHSQSSNEDSVTIGGFNALEKVYAYEPIPKELNEEEGKYVLGAQANMWTEYMKNTSKVEYMMFPRMIALSEVLWSPAAKRNWKDFERRLPILFKRLEKNKINYSKAYYDLKATITPSDHFKNIEFKLLSNLPKADIRYRVNNAAFKNYDQPIIISHTAELSYALFTNGSPVKISSQKFSFNKATGKKITIVNEPSKSYPGHGAFTLVDGIQNEKGLARSSDFLGFKGTDLDVTIDLGSEMDISKVTLHVLKQSGSWIYLPKTVEVTYIPHIDTTIITRHAPLESVTVDVNADSDLSKIEIKKLTRCRYIRLLAKNYGIIPQGRAGSGNPAWLFADEIEIN